MVHSGCGSEGNPFGAGSDAGATADGSATTVDGGTTMQTPEGWPVNCEPAPARMVVLGDSIVACVNVGGKDGPNCSPKQLFTVLSAKYPNLVYQNLAVGGAVTADVPRTQLAGVTTGPGHVLAVIMVGGNDLSPYIFKTDAETQAGYDANKPGIQASWEQIFAFFADKTKFPDGATVLMNKQYNPFDDCTASPYGVSALKIELLHNFNEQLAQLAKDHSGAYIADQYTSFLGHGHHYAAMACPHYMPNAVPWMDDLIHPNVAGHANLGAVFAAAADKLYTSCH
jgi:lysophospholipase L1-like esterase